MGFFSNFFDSSKPGRGVSKEEVQREREKITVNGFFKILKRKFWQLMQLNMLSFVFYIPLIILIVFTISSFVIPFKQIPLVSDEISEQAYIGVWNILNSATDGAVGQSAFTTDLFMRIHIGVFFTAIPMIAFGPLQAGFTYIIQSFIRERSVFLTHDFFSRAKSNFKQSFLVSLINFVITALFVWELYFYSNVMKNGDVNFFWTAAMVFISIIFIVFMLMNLYIYPILVTFNVTFRQLYKNSFLLAMTSFFPGLLVLLIDIVLLIIIAVIFTVPMYQILLICLFAYGLIGLINNYFSYKYIKFHLLDPALAAAEEKRQQAEEDDF